MRAPEFWYRQDTGTLASLLSPAGWVYGRVVAARLAGSSAERVSVPVICVGNLLAGGTGKTPVAMDIVERLQSQSVNAHILTRGYGGTEIGPVCVDPKIQGAAEVGDEALLLAARAPTWVAADRARGANAAVAAGAQALVMDDGFQNPGLHKDLSIVVFDGSDGVGNGRIIPAGPLREKFSKGLARADAAAVIGEDVVAVGDQILGGTETKMALLRAKFEPGPEKELLRDSRVIAFAGIGRPRKFFETLKNIGCDVVETHPFPDHHRYRVQDLEILKTRGAKVDARLVTTAKDAKRLPPGFDADVAVLTVSLSWEDDTALENLLRDALRGRLEARR